MCCIAAFNLQKTCKPSSLKPQQLFCANCNEIVLTKVEKKVGDGALLMGGVLFMCGCFLGCCLIPCFLDDFKDAKHFCMKCNSELGVFSYIKI